jgi:hypothetical protein
MVLMLAIGLAMSSAALVGALFEIDRIKRRIDALERRS